MDAVGAVPRRSGEDDVDFQLLVLGTSDDWHVRTVTNRLTELGYRSCVLDHNHPPDFRVRQGSSGQITFRVDDHAWDTSCGGFTVRARSKLWWGSPLFFGAGFENQPDQTDAETLRSLQYLADEWRELYRFMMSLYAESVLNHPATVLLANKLQQQQAAASVGFLVPSTIVSNSKDEFDRFLDRHDGAIMKSLANVRVLPEPDADFPAPSSVMTIDVDRRAVRAAARDQFSAGPLLVQRKVPKDHELRIVAVGERLFGFRIPSQDYEHTKTDWRYGNGNIPFLPVELTPEVQERTLAVVGKCGLEVGSVDLIVDRESRVWFLEVNAEGQWGWLDQIVGGEIHRAFVEYVIERTRRVARRR